jgi:6-phospho-beta-glucosidase
MKLTVVGGGSTYTPELVDGIARMRSVLDVRELALVDPATERLERIGQLARRMFAREQHEGEVTWTSDLAEGVAGANVVLIQLRVGGQQARRVDETLPLACGCIGQETTGVGGLAKALRTVPVVLDVAERVRRHAAPDAWIVDFTNPVGIVTRALLDAGHRAVGLCNVAIGFQRRFAAHLGVDPARVRLDHVGLNHLTWVRAVHVDGRDVLPRLLNEHLDAIAEDLGLPPATIAALGMVPSYYLRYYYAHDEVLEELRHSRPRADLVAEVERDLLERYADPALDTKPEQLQARGGAFYSEAAVDLVASLTTDRGDVQVVNVRNEGLFPQLADDAVVEVPARITAEGPAPEPTAPLEPLLAGLVAHVSAYEELALDAARRGGRDRVVRALLAHPLVGQIRLAERLADDVIAANRQHLSWAG